MAIQQFTVTIYSDGSVITLDMHNTTMTEFSGKLSILHKIIRYNKRPDKGQLDDDVKIYDPRYYFCVTGTNKPIEIPKTHIIKFVKHIKDIDLDNPDFAELASRLYLSPEQLKDNKQT